MKLSGPSKRARSLINTRCGMTLVETVVVVLVSSILISALGTLMIVNWTALDERMRRANLAQSLNEITLSMTDHGRIAKEINVTDNGDGTFAIVMSDSSAGLISRYETTLGNELQLTVPDGGPFVLTDKLNLTGTNFAKNGRLLRVELALQDALFTRLINVDTATDIYPRN